MENSIENMHTDITCDVKALLTSVTLFLQQKVNNVFIFLCNKAAQVHQGQLFPDWLMSTNLALKKHQLSQWSYRTALVGWMVHIIKPIVHFTVVCLVAKPLNRNEAEGDLVMIQTLLLLKCKLICYHAN